MSYKAQVLEEIVAKLTQLSDQDAIDNLRVEVMSNGKRQVFVTDSNMMTVPELGRLVCAQQSPKLRLV